MAGLIPFNRKRTDLMNTGFDGFRNMLEDFFSPDWPLGRSLAADTFKIDVQETDKEYIVEAEMPGADKEDISLALNDGQLTIGFNKQEITENKEKNYIHQERRYSSMSRSIYLADAASNQAKAKLENGVLFIHVPKAERPDHSVSIDIE